jgi:hypothetical protein
MCGVSEPIGRRWGRSRSKLFTLPSSRSTAQIEQIRHCRGKALDVQARREKDLLARNKALSDCSGRCGSYGCERAEAIGSS